MFAVYRHNCHKPNPAFYLLKRRDDPQALAAYNNKQRQWERERARLMDALKEKRTV